MDANRFYSIPYDARNDPAMKKLRRKHGGIKAFGQYQALLGILYDEGNRLHLSDGDDRGLLMEELEIDDEELDKFLNSCAKFDLIDCEEFCGDYPIVTHKGVAKELAYKKMKSDAGRAGGIASAKARKKTRNEAE